MPRQSSPSCAALRPARRHTSARSRNGAASGTAPLLVVDRPRWIQANLDGFRQILLPLNAKMIERMKQSNPTDRKPGSSNHRRRSGRAAQLSVVKGPRSVRPVLSGTRCRRTRGRLLLVAPNIVAIERELDVEPADFRLWVCLHEETHRVQFGAVPWLRGYLNAQIATIVDSAELDPAIVAQMLRDALRRVIEGSCRIKRCRSSTSSRHQRSGKRSIG